MSFLSRTCADDSSAAISGEDSEANLSESTRPKLIPLAVVASELDCGVKDLRRRLNGNVIRDEAGIRCAPATVVRQLVTERDERIAAVREAERQRLDGNPRNPYRERVRAAKDRQRCASLGVDALSMAQKAIAIVVQPESPAELDESMTEADERTSDFMSGQMQLRKIGPSPSSRRRRR